MCVGGKEGRESGGRVTAPLTRRATARHPRIKSGAGSLPQGERVGPGRKGRGLGQAARAGIFGRWLVEVRPGGSSLG